ncbi:MAG: hypothetical protein Q9213_002271 [Squamulea squamosa]
MDVHRDPHVGNRCEVDKQAPPSQPKGTIWDDLLAPSSDGHERDGKQVGCILANQRERGHGVESCSRPDIDKAEQSRNDAPTHVARTVNALNNVSTVSINKIKEVNVPTNAQADASSPMPHETPLLFHPPTFSKFAKTNDAVLRGDRYTNGTKNTKKKQTW